MGNKGKDLINLDFTENLRNINPQVIHTIHSLQQFLSSSSISEM